jgi:hypothetical protein
MKSYRPWLLLAAVVLTLAFGTGCKKEIVVINQNHHFVVETDNPPQILTTDKQPTICWLNKASLDSATRLGELNQTYCINYYDPNTGQLQNSYDCGIWRLVPGVPYWGEIDSPGGDTTVYIGTGRIWAAMSEHSYSTADYLIKGSGRAVVDLQTGTNFWLNPFYLPSTFTNPRQK